MNIPIKYLLITGTNFASAKLSVRNFQNLIGRAGRSGVYTEGNIIVTESKLYDERMEADITNGKILKDCLMEQL